MHEPLLNKFRDHSALAKKVSKALGKGEVNDAARLQRIHTPRITLDHIVKERYPTFQDALRDLDDALSMLFLFANLPSSSNVPPKTIALCQRLCVEFEQYLITTHSLRKSFLSIKGIYYQATVEGQDILWLVPYKFVQRVTNDVDFRIMATFIEFYTALLGFVNYRLYTSVGLVYPPKIDPKSEESGGELDAFALERQGARIAANSGPETSSLSGHQTNGDHNNFQNHEAKQEAQSLVDAIAATSDPSQDVESVNAPSPVYSGAEDDASAPTTNNTFPDPVVSSSAVLEDTTTLIPQPAPSSRMLSISASKLFKPYTFYLSREAPRAPLELMLKAFGCQRVGWDPVSGAGAFTYDESDQRITHQIVDRPPMPISANGDDANEDDGEQATPTTASFAKGQRVPGRIYVQPQWVWDCVNSSKLLRPDLYAPGAALPPHLSPFVRPKTGRPEYVPDDPLAEEQAPGEAFEVGEEAKDVLETGSISNAATNGSVYHGMDEKRANRVNELEGDWAGFSSGEDNIAASGRPKDDAAVERPLHHSDSDRDSDSGSDSDSYQRSLALEATSKISKPHNSSKRLEQAEDATNIGKGKAKQQREREKRNWELERRKMMMSGKKRKLYEKMVHSDRTRQDEVDRLREKKGRRMAEAV